MKDELNFPTRNQLDLAFTVLQDQITRISVEEDEELIQAEIEGKCN